MAGEETRCSRSLRARIFFDGRLESTWRDVHEVWCFVGAFRWLVGTSQGRLEPAALTHTLYALEISMHFQRKPPNTFRGKTYSDKKYRGK